MNLIHERHDRTRLQSFDCKGKPWAPSAGGEPCVPANCEHLSLLSWNQTARYKQKKSSFNKVLF